ncbi:hypothetical protein OG767_10295 [Micromonospora sp. NBC_01392]|uniref:hypothetical protein n=1 Tax=Micromonospora sp. NBC_01392 TaxID=2903588 RepID=UPI003245DF4E
MDEQAESGVAQVDVDDIAKAGLFGGHGGGAITFGCGENEPPAVWVARLDRGDRLSQQFSGYPAGDADLDVVCADRVGGSEASFGAPL